MIVGASTERGSLNEGDNRALQSGWLAIARYPPTPAIVTLDASRLPDGTSELSQIRTAFYMGTVANYPEAQTKGIHIIQSIARQPLMSFHLTMILLGMMHKVLPIRISKIVCVKSDVRDRRSLANFYSHKIGTAMSNMFGESVATVVNVTEERQTSAYLEAFDIPRSSIPVEMGGEWTYEHLFEWQQHASTVTRNTPVSSSSLLSSGDMSNRSSSDSQREDELSSARNALYSRRSYHRRKAMENEIEVERDELEKEHSRLVLENERLKNLLAQAHEVLNSLKASVKDKDKDNDSSNR